MVVDNITTLDFGVTFRYLDNDFYCHLNDKRLETTS